MSEADGWRRARADAGLSTHDAYNPFIPAECPQTRFPDGTRCGEYGWHASNCPQAPTQAEEAGR